MRLYTAVAGFMFLLLLAVYAPIAAADGSQSNCLQDKIDLAAPGETLTIPQGIYKGPVVISKPLLIDGEGRVEIRNDSEQPAIRIAAADVVLTNLSITETAMKETPAILATADRTVLTNLAVYTNSMGIQILDANEGRIAHNVISRAEKPGKGSLKLTDQRNGIDLWNAQRFEITGNTISNRYDGIYAENSDDLHIADNLVTHSRYGIHVMYSSGASVMNNEGFYNVTGAMVMGVTQAKVSGNRFAKQSENVHSQGLLLFDVTNSVVQDNVLEGNRIGMYMEYSKHNQISHNKIMRNFIGVQLKDAVFNQFTHNEFTANVIPAEAMESVDNQVAMNYWDSFQGLDTTGDGISELDYRINPFFLKLTKAVPPFQLFFHSPGMLLLEDMMSVNEEDWTKDSLPLLEPSLSDGISVNRRVFSYHWLGWSLLMLVLSVSSIYYLGVRRI